MDSFDFTWNIPAMISSTWQYKQRVVLSSTFHLCTRAAYIFIFCCISCGVYQGHSWHVHTLVSTLKLLAECYFRLMRGSVAIRYHDIILAQWRRYLKPVLDPSFGAAKNPTREGPNSSQNKGFLKRFHGSKITAGIYDQTIGCGKLWVICWKSSTFHGKHTVHLTKLEGNFSGWLLHFRAKLLK